jgi:hypothetical protein
MGFGVYFNDDHEIGNPDCPRCRMSHALLGQDGPASAMPRECIKIVDGYPCGGLVHSDAEQLNPWSGIAVVECCDRCGSDGLDEL